jgi:hypothetical protein
MSNYDSKADTAEHIGHVRHFLYAFMRQLGNRAADHDESKFGSEEKPFFDKITPLLKTLTYGSDEYKASLKELGTALQHHYQVNSHHPEHYPNGVAGMNLLDLVEMFCDWRAASMRTKDGDFFKSVEIGIDRFKIEPMLAQILRNSLPIPDPADRSIGLTAKDIGEGE